MPSGTSGRYQSRLFNFFHQQSRRWGEQFDRTIRHLQVAASWSLEALLYPVYLLIQKATDSAGKQLHTGEQQRKFHLPANETDSQSKTPLSADTPIQQVLDAVVTLQVVETRRDLLENSSCPSTVQGIASLLVNRNLVLVTADNEILDILTYQQQEKLRNRILDGVAAYWRSWRLTQAEDETKLLPEIDRLLNKLISGRQENRPALPEATRKQEDIEYTSLPIPSQGLVLLDAAFAQLESHAITPISRVSGQLLQIVQTQLNIFLYGKQQQLTTEQGALAVDGKHQTSKIQALIWGAINYFFGERNAKKLKPEIPANGIIDQPLLTNPNRKLHARLQQHPSFSALPKTPHLQSEDIADPWLTMNDLFGDLQEGAEVINEQQLLVASSQNTKFVSPSPDSSISPLESKANKSKEKKGKILHQQRQKTTEVEAKPDWIETQAQTIGYEKHLLEQILEWLDRVMLWLEDIFVKIGFFLQGLLRGR
ncbi:hypothetical protein BZZ01_08350 [Nostocales cyanobacterium HT-58-2]|nr:hypothetical protein BZZ01_08350 [Nostocales cyanobacterium HT-58-2]